MRIPRRNGLAGRLRSPGLLLMLAAATAGGEPGNHTPIYPSAQYEAFLELSLRQSRVELSCQVAADKPLLGFDLRFHSEYRVTLPMKVLAGAGGWLQTAMRVTALQESERTVYLAHRFAIPDVSPGIKGDATLTSGLELGPGRYRVDWFMSDARERVCSAHWELEAKTGGGKQDLPLTLGPNQIVDTGGTASGVGSQIKLDLARSLRVKVLLNVSPARAQESILATDDSSALLSMLRSIVGQPGIGLSSLVAFNLREQKIVYREDAGRIDLSALEKATQSPTAGTVDIRVLRDPHSETRFATSLLTDQLGAQADSPDAIIIIGAKVSLKTKVPLEALRAKGAPPCPVFYLNYDSNSSEPWADTIGSALKAYKGAAAYNIVLPHDLGLAVRDMLARIGKQPNS